MTSLYNYRTVSTPRIFPPMPVNPPPAPKLSMAADAKRCNARIRKAWGQTGNEMSNGSGFNGKDHNAARTAAARERNAEMAEVVRAILHREGPQKVQQLMAATGMTESGTYCVLRFMRDGGQVVAPLRGQKAGWALV